MTVPVEPIATEERGAVRQNRRNRNVAIPDTPTIAHAPTEMRADTTIIDTDIHVYFSSQDVLRSYLGARWQDYHQMYGARGYHGSHYPRAMPNAARHDAWPDDGTPPGSNLPLLQAQLLDRWGIEIGILNPLVGAGEQRNLEFGAAFARATNEWQLREWLEREPRLRASIVVPWEDGELAAAEIDRWGGHPGFVHALLIARTKEPLGRRKYWPIYEAACRHDVPVAVHFGGAGGVPITGSGYPSHYIEDHGGMPQSFQAQVISLIFEGVFQQFPTLNVVLIEGGFGWIPPMLWRMDNAWRMLGSEVPHLNEPPSDIFRRHFWVSTQPMEEPFQPGQFRQLLGQLDLDDHLLFATDYPHWDFDSPDRAFPIPLDKERRRKIMAENARLLYKL
jgi:predicted TIM-barrel fold metal-dependent hydrolase